MVGFNQLPFRQKFLIGLTTIVGLILLVSSIFKLTRPDILNACIFFYGIGVPVSLLTSNAVIDLNDKSIFRIWLMIAFVTFFISLTGYNNERFKIRRSIKFDPDSGVNRFLSEYSTSALKTLLLFLIIYYLLNKMLNKKGVFLINTFKQGDWYHDIARRDISGFDVFTNIILFIIIAAAGLFGC